MQMKPGHIQNDKMVGLGSVNSSTVAVYLLCTKTHVRYIDILPFSSWQEKLLIRCKLKKGTTVKWKCFQHVLGINT